MTDAADRKMREPPVVPVEAPPDVPQLFYRRGYRLPRAIAWFGFKSFWGHMWHLGASAMATEDIDCRDWMHADLADELTRRVAAVIDAKDPGAPSLTEALGEDLWIDFIADTGDDFSVSRAVGRMLFSRYDVPDPDRLGERLILPRGHLLVFGGDTAYPVATEVEIQNRVIAPFTRALRAAGRDGRRRALLGIPGNHDWYASLDGFGRLFRARRAQLDRKKKVGPDDTAPAQADGEKVDPLANLKHFVRWVEAFRVGDSVVKRSALAIEGYTPVQSASYWALRLAPSLDFWGIDRQLRLVDFEQRAYFAETRGDRSRGIVLALADPVYAFLEPNPAGVGALKSLDLSVERDGLLVLTGDTHHYCRQKFGAGMHVIAGGGGAFLHPACVARHGKPAPESEFPGPKVTWALALQVPWQIVHGRSGFLLHAIMALLLLPLYGVQSWTGAAGGKAAIGTAAVVAIACVFLGGFRQHTLKIGGLSILTGLAVGLMPYGVHDFVRVGSAHIGLHLTPIWSASVAYGLAIYAGVLAIGTYLMLLTILGLEQHQAFSALAHPGYKHFVRLRVRRDGSRVDAWTLGRVDPLSKLDAVVLVDRFTWRNPKHVP